MIHRQLMLAIALLAIEIASCYQRNHVLSLTSRLMHYNALLSSDTSLEAETSASNIRKSVRLINLVNEYTSYDLAWKWQQELVDYHIDLQSASKGTDDIPVGTLLIIQHKPVYTLGTATTEGSGPFSSIARDGTGLTYDIFHVERAGQATYHGPGQVVIYPILDLAYFNKDINWYLRCLEDVAIDVLAKYNIIGERKPDVGHTGVWIGNSKIAAIGIKIRRWVTMHGMSINVAPDMRYFDNIVPCGITDKAVASLEQYHPQVDINEVTQSIIEATSKKLDVCFTHHKL